MLLSFQIPSFFETLESPSVEEYMHQQELALEAVSAPVNSHCELPMLGLDVSMRPVSGSDRINTRQADVASVNARRKSRGNTRRELPMLGLDVSMLNMGPVIGLDGLYSNPNANSVEEKKSNESGGSDHDNHGTRDSIHDLKSSHSSHDLGIMISKFRKLPMC